MTRPHLHRYIITDIETKNFFAAVGDAEEILGALTSPGVHATLQVQSLEGFVRILRALITIRIPIIERSEWGNSTNFNQLLAGIPCEDWKMISHYDSVNSFSKSVKLTRAEREEAVLRYAADGLCKLLKDEILPMRYRMFKVIFVLLFFTLLLHLHFHR